VREGAFPSVKVYGVLRGQRLHVKTTNGMELEWWLYSNLIVLGR